MMKKKLLLIFCAFMLSFSINAQVYNPQLGAAVHRLDEIINAIDNNHLTNQTIAYNQVAQVLNNLTPVIPNIWLGMNVPINPITNVGDLTRNVMLPLIGFDCIGVGGSVGVQNISLEDLPFLLDNINHTATITWIQNQIELDLGLQANTYSTLRETEHYRTKQQEIVTTRMDEIMSTEFSNYRFTNTSKSWLKWISVSHSNDVLFFSYPGLNDDRDYTGGFRFEAATDKFKMRFSPPGLFAGFAQKLNVNWIRNLDLNSRNWYTYQSILIGGDGYTPYLRDTCVFNSPTSVDSLDRPYASYQYFGRTKYRISRRGRVSLKGEFRLGTIGKSSPGALQALIHRDLVTTAVTPNGWESQIANGGRIAFSYIFSGEILLFKLGHLDNHLIYPSLLWNGSLGHDNTSFALGFNLSNRSLKERGGIDLNFTRPNWFDITWNYSTSVRYMQHNSMLEGYGIFKMAKDEDPNSPRDAYVLEKNQVERWIWRNDFSVNFMFAHMGIFIKQSIWTPEFNIQNKDGQTLQQYKNWSDWNHVGTIGVLWKL